MQKIAIINASTVLKDSDIGPVVAALQQQVSQDFAPVWGIDAEIVFIEGGSPDQAAWQLVVLDNSDQAGALGYHDLTANGLPMGKAFAGTDIQYGESWSITLSHELLEMLVDPEINLCAMVNDEIYAYEVCDAVEDDSIGYTILGVQVSDFVFPNWFCEDTVGPWDQCSQVSKPLELCKGGYISCMSVGNSSWQQINDDDIRPHRRAPVGSRRERRTVPRYQWKRSSL